MIRQRCCPAAIAIVSAFVVACASPRTKLEKSFEIRGNLPKTAATASKSQKPGAVGPEPPAHTNTQTIQSLPAKLTIGRSIERSMIGDRHIRVAHAPANRKQAIVYLHGMCGDPKGAEPWLSEALQFGTLVVVRANIPCKDRPGYRWPKDVRQIEKRILAALEVVRSDRAGLLLVESPLLVGYSQGAHRGERLAAAYPERYKRLVLGGPPTSPSSELLGRAHAIAILGGELEEKSHMENGAAELAEAGLHTRFFILPRAHHGSYGPEGSRVMNSVFAWVHASP